MTETTDSAVLEASGDGHGGIKVLEFEAFVGDGDGAAKDIGSSLDVCLGDDLRGDPHTQTVFELKSEKLNWRRRKEKGRWNGMEPAELGDVGKYMRTADLFVLFGPALTEELTWPNGAEEEKEGSSMERKEQEGRKERRTGRGFGRGW